MAKAKTGRLGTALERAVAIGPRLDAATDRLGKRFKSVEAKLLGVRLGVKGAVDFASYPAEGGGTHPLLPGLHLRLLFCRFSETWRLVVEERPEGNDFRPEDVTLKPLQACSRRVRLAAVDLLPDLVESMVSNGEALVSEIERKIVEVDAFIDEF